MVARWRAGARNKRKHKECERQFSASAFTLCHDFAVISELTHQMRKAEKNIIKPDFLFPLFFVKRMISSFSFMCFDGKAHK